MSDHLTIGELERLRANEQADERSNERSLNDLRAHIESCASCRDKRDELDQLDAFAEQVRELASPEQPAQDGALQIPGYQLSHEIHRGGQGIVFAATQDSTGRQVAVKVLLHGVLASQKQRIRFEREVDYAARINHPNVVAIIDRGTTRDDRGFFVMELIDGPTLDGYLETHRPTLEQRLRLFIEICDGVQAAHQRGVLHRDLKPGNILIDQSGRAKVLDFGLAKDDLADSVTIARTIAGEFMGTLAYASPEQLRGDPGAIDSRADVYALGVILYEMVTGTLPHDMTGAIDEVIRRVLEQDPRRPSGLVPKLDPDLDTVILHALEHDAERRYPSVDAFRADVLSILEHRPVMARRSSAAYQIRKFARRHRVGVLVSFVVVLGLLGTVTGLSIGIVRANAANRIAEQRRQEAETELQKQYKVSTFMNDLLAEVDPGQSGPDMRVTELLDVASEQVVDQFAPYPDLRGALQLVLGETYTRLGSYGQAEAELMAGISALNTIEPSPSRSLAKAYILLGQVQTATTRLQEAHASLHEAESHLAQSGDSDVLPQVRAQLEHQQGALYYEEGEFEQSIKAYHRSIDTLGDIDTPEEKRIVSQALIGLGVSLKRLERFEEGLQAYERALAYLQEVRSPNHPDTLACLSNRAEILNNLGRAQEAEAQMLDLLERRRAVFGNTHERVGITLNNLADLLSARGAFEEATQYFDEAIAIFRVSPGDPSLRLAITMHNVGVMHLKQERLDLASDKLREAWQMSTGLLPEGHWIQAQFGTKYAECLIGTGSHDPAREILEDTYPDLLNALGEDHRRTLFAKALLEQSASSEQGD
ncbi:MAG: tetratricopeptide repeat protein [Phycisphaerales bacterium JB052]